MPRPAVVLVLLRDRTTERDTACARTGYSGRCWASRAWSSRTSRSGSIRTVTRRSWWCRCALMLGLPAGVVSAGGRARGTTPAPGPGGGGRWTPAPFARSCRPPAPRVRCPEHGVVVADVPWARPGAKCTYLLEDTCAWLVKNMALSAVAVFLRLSWRTVTGLVARVVQDLTGKTDRLDGLRRIGIDEIAYRK